MEVMTRQAALLLDEPRYCTGKTCKHGHRAQRFARNGVCVQCQREANERYRETRDRLVRWRISGEQLSREQAIERGLSVYWTGEPCELGHLGERSVKDDGCVMCEMLS